MRIVLKQQRQKSRRVGSRFLVGCLLLVCCLLSAGDCVAVVADKCSECHTMHRSQDGQVLSEWGTDGPYAALLVTDCGGCHMGTNTAGSMPYVLSSVAPIYGDTGTEENTNTLAGGSFYWVSQAMGDDKGHNVVGLAPADSTLATPPGFDGLDSALDGSTPGGGTWPPGIQVTCAGIYGCHGSHANTIEVTAIRGGHHKGLEGAITNPEVKPYKGYRFLVGIVGYEDPEWELTPTAAAHNQYKGTDGTADKSTISALCQRCHGEFHQDSVAGVWSMHPVNYDLSNTATDSEYRDYGGVTHDYQPAAPLASTAVSGPVSSITFGGGEAIISCVSCHRAHGSPYQKMLRWDYFGSGSGCAYCHTSKS